MSYQPDSRVDAYIDALPPWQGEICQEVRELVHTADPEVEETIKRSVQPYFVLQGNIAALQLYRTSGFVPAGDIQILALPLQRGGI